MSITPYQIAHNNPVWKIEIEGLEGTPSNGKTDLLHIEPASADYKLGHWSAIADNALGGLLPIRRWASNFVDYPTDFNNGLETGDRSSFMMGVAEMTIGGAMQSGGTALLVSTGGVLSEIGVPVADPVIIAQAHGAIMTGSATANLMTKKGHMEENSGNSSHGNSKSSTKEQHNYDIEDTHNNNSVVKTGTSSGKETKAGNSYRGNAQANKWNKQGVRQKDIGRTLQTESQQAKEPDKKHLTMNVIEQIM